MNSASIEQARAAKQHAIEILSDVAEVVGVGLTRIEEGYGLKVNLSATPKDIDNLPHDVDGVPVRLEVVGKVRKRLDE